MSKNARQADFLTLLSCFCKQHIIKHNESTLLSGQRERVSANEIKALSALFVHAVLLII